MTQKTEMLKIAEDLAAIRRLLISALQRNGMSQEAVATALGVNQSSISRMFGKGGHPSGTCRKVNAEVTDA